MSPSAAFAAQLGLLPGQASHLIALANKAAFVQEKWHNGDATDAQADTAVQAVETYTTQFGIQTQWPGLYPTFQREGHTVYLPG